MVLGPLSFVTLMLTRKRPWFKPPPTALPSRGCRGLDGRQTTPMTLASSPTEGQDLCWIHIKDVFTFLYLGANPHEQKVGQNIRIDLSVQIPYQRTLDQLSKTVDYSGIIERVQAFIASLGKVNLLEYLAEQVMDLIGREFPGVLAARLCIYKAFVPLTHFTGSVAIEVLRQYNTSTTQF